MRIAVVSDVHGNLSALHAVMADIKDQSPDAVFHLGDLAANGPRPAEVVDAIRDAGWPGVYGNTDEMLWRPEIVDELDRRFPARQPLRRTLINEIGPVTSEMLGPDRLNYLRSLPLTLRVEDIFLCHASPTDPWVSPRESDPDEKFAATFGDLAAATAVFGHIHVPLIRKLATITVVNTGATSLSYDGDWRASYVIIDGDRVTHRRVEYDIDREVSILVQSSLPRREWIASMLRSGKYSDPS